jgi:Cu/Ag efflux protein CusF
VFRLSNKLFFNKRALIVTILVLLLSTSCSSQTFESTATSTEEVAKVDINGTNGKLIPIQSDNVNSAGYDETTMVMTVQFRNGAIYEYYGVKAELWTSFVAAQPHPWSQVGYPRLVEVGIPYKRIG